MYEITINKIDQVEYEKEGDWKIIDERPYTDEEIEKANQNWQSDSLKQIN